MILYGKKLVDKKLFLVNKRNILKFDFDSLKETTCYYLSNDYSYFIRIKSSLPNINLLNLRYEFRNAVKELWEPYLDLFAELSKKYNSLSWWGSTIASRNVASTPLFLNIVYLYCAEKIIVNTNNDILIIADDETLLDCIEELAVSKGYNIIRGKRKIWRIIERVEIFLRISAKIAYFLWQNLRLKVLTFFMLKKTPLENWGDKKTVIVRSWINQGNFDKNGIFNDRNFGDFPAWLSSRGYIVWTLPMFFSLSVPFKKILLLMKKSGTVFLMPHQFLKLKDYIQLIFIEFKFLKFSFSKIRINHFDVSRIFSNIQLKQIFSPDLLTLNLSYFLLKRMNEKGIRISAFYYAFENNPPEKLFIMGVREFYPHSSIKGYQHSAWYSEQSRMYLSRKELAIHPLPDSIITHGPIYANVLKQAGFPPDILKIGPNLRFSYISSFKNVQSISNTTDKRNIMLPLSFDKNLSFELIYKVKEAFKKNNNIHFFIKPHPFYCINDLKSYLEQINMINYEINFDETIQELLTKSHITISTGCTICILESVIMGKPTIRVAPDNYFFLDPIVWSNYPLKPVSCPEEIQEQINLIDEILIKDNGLFVKIAAQIRNNYFSEPNEEALKNLL